MKMQPEAFYDLANQRTKGRSINAQNAVSQLAPLNLVNLTSAYGNMSTIDYHDIGSHVRRMTVWADADGLIT